VESLVAVLNGTLVSALSHYVSAVFAQERTQ
jgi:hypothetical protein